MTQTRTHFSPLARLLHWTMAPLIIAMLFIGVGMVATVSRAHTTLIAIHKPLGIALLLLVILRVGVRIRRGSPPLPAYMPAPQRIAARLSHLILYALMIAMPADRLGDAIRGGISGHAIRSPAFTADRAA
ncbi:hypothetical protein LMG24238_03659 [Paraburkholderia sediminicola]|uniref:Cytochrome b561 bacterial/Ni-hydrogenase domain-containing protein n=1 Tax=Paraburkholderia sediminicola TaxID=458836 RepID=A0A6J5BDF8_9BURK|nr:hypothetical protein LMG24238_03659 [Paraburkholderia sediminicola]